MTTRIELNTLIRRRLNDQAAPQRFTDEQINQWINDAIEEYSRYFPRAKTATISTTANDRTYDLPGDYRGILSVEYPTGDDPPSYLERRDFRHPNFWLEDGFYDVVHRTDAGNLDEVWISQKPAAGQTITVEYLGDHDLVDDDTDTTSILDLHLEVLILHVRWSATQAMATAEAANPDPNNIMMDRYEANVTRAERTFYRKIEELQKVLTESGMNVWPMDKWDQVY